MLFRDVLGARSVKVVVSGDAGRASVESRQFILGPGTVERGVGRDTYRPVDSGSACYPAQ